MTIKIMNPFDTVQ